MGKIKHIRSSRNAIIYIIFGALVAIALMIYGLSVFLRVMEVEVTGVTKYTKADIIEASGISAGDNILLLDAAEAERNIRAAMPYINEVSVQPSLPALIRISVSESTAVAVIDHRNSILLIDSSGKVLDILNAVPRGLIEIRGFTPLEAEVGSRLRAMSGGETQLRSMTDVLTEFEKAEILSEITYLDVTHISTISFGYTGRFTVILGGSANASHKLNQLPVFIMMIDEERPGEVSGVINMSNSTGEWIFVEER